MKMKTSNAFPNKKEEAMKVPGFSWAMKRVFLGWASRLLLSAAFFVGAFGRVDANVSEDSQEEGISYVGYGLGLLGLSCEDDDGIPWPGPLSQ